MANPMNKAIKQSGLLLVLILVLAGCAGKQAFNAGDRFFQQGKYDLAMEQYAAAVAAEPERHEYRLKWLKARNRSALQHYERGNQLAAENEISLAAAEYRQAVTLDGNLAVAVQRLRELQARVEAQQLVAEAEEFYEKGKYGQAKANLRKALHLMPSDPGAQDLLRQVELASQTIMDGYELALSSREPLSLQFAEMDLHQAFAVLSQLSGIHFILDEDINPRPVSLLLKKASFAQVLDLLLKLNGLGKRVLNSQTILVYPRTKEKEKQYEDRIIQVFYLSHIEAKKAVNLLRTILQTRKIYVHDELNAIVMRDKPEVIELARQILEASDRNDSEVVFDLELVEVSHRDLLDIGPKLSSYSISAGMGRTILDTDGNVVTNLVSDTLAAGGTTDTLVRSFSRLESFYTLPTATFDFAKTLIDSEILANPKIRVKNREKAKVHIGTKEPIVTTNISTTTGDVTSTNVQYIDVGVKLDVEPNIQLDDTIVTKLTLEVSSILEKEEIAGGGSALRISTTNAGSSLILKDGERTIIGGLIRNDLSDTRDTLPFIGSIPIIGHLFTGRSKEKNKSEILLSITPHIVRSVDMPRPDVATIWSGGEDDLAPGARFARFTDEDPAETSEPSKTEAGPKDSTRPHEFQLSGPETVAPERSFALQVSAMGIRSLLSARFALRYPSALVQPVGVVPGALMGTQGQESHATMSASDGFEEVVIDVQREVGKSGVSGEGPVAIVEFKTIGEGSLVFSLDDCTVNTGQGLSDACTATPLTIEME
ncbi:type II secretion system secretin lipoprotein PulQ [Syntrophotalea carbinolica DSM 2380]|uniref:Type II secretion system secretin lipoprotein PulQ n=1 Tax=Syntrophotalea carbinolica (strain DSM 2380 / NBRC 103641 / GraBd1) TaxID=338963 RepID=Q3A3Y5_SYNC1|nr:secretin N-terminal domain-containing protein [Syntrophotalea carbinolica]ABA88922.1 type II secretion system secretin lipoprotein PulQ [Syntrophotalea carbinolica DSM 2380]